MKKPKDPEEARKLKKKLASIRGAQYRIYQDKERERLAIEPKDEQGVIVRKI